MMSDADFFAGLTGSDNDLTLAVRALRAGGQPFCLIGGLAVNHYVEPVVTLDAEFAVTAQPGVAEALRGAGFQVTEHPHPLNATLPGSRLRLQITIISRYAAFPSRALPATLFGVEMPVAALIGLSAGKDALVLRKTASDTLGGHPTLFGRAEPREPSPVRFKVVRLGTAFALLALVRLDPSKPTLSLRAAETALKPKSNWSALGAWDPLF
jgi:hypothetical protein